MIYSPELVDKLCDDYESAWLTNKTSPDLQGWIEENVESVSQELLIQLLRLDLEYRTRSVDDFDVASYLRGFDLTEDAVRSQAFGRGQLTATSDMSRSVAHEQHSDVPSRIGRFQLIRELGRGGFGRVYLARDESLGRDVALKVPRSVFADDPSARLQGEASLAALLDHPGIVPIHEVGEWNGEFYIVSAFCPGENLRQWITKQDVITPEISARIIQCLAEATQHAHNRGVVHRDLKPGNVMMVPIESGNNELPYAPRITDFGLAKLVEQQMEDTNSSLMLGTPNYMAPEQFYSGDSGYPFASDVYAIGVILYELLTGQRPHEGKTFPEVMDAVRSGEITPPSTFNPSVPRDLETICLKCLNFRPEDRFESCGKLAEDVSCFLQGHAIRAQRPAMRDRLGDWLRDPKRKTEAGLLTMLAGFGVPVWITVMILLVWKDGLEASVGNELFPQAGALFLFVLFPMGYAGYRTIQGSRGWMWFALVQSVSALIQVIPPLFGVIFVFPELYSRYPLGRIVAYSAVSLLFMAQILQYVTLLRFQERPD